MGILDFLDFISLGTIMGYGQILKLKKIQDTKIEKTFVKNLIVGQDIFAIDLCLRLNEIEAKSAKLLSPEKVTKENLMLLGPSLFRGHENIEHLKKLGIEKEVHKSIFYKDMNFHEFGKRTKPLTMLWGEEWFSQEHVKLNLEDIFPNLTDDFMNKLNDLMLELSISKIETATPDDLIDRAFYRVTCSNGLVIECENLYFGLTPNFFYELFEDKKILSDSFVEFCESTKTPCVLYIHMILENKITDDLRTMFLPLSFTHDWGHFIGEIEDSGSGQIAKFVTFINKEENTEEDISRKIRLLKKNFEKIFPQFSDKKCREYVVLKESTYCPKIDDSLLKSESDIPKNIFFVGANGTFSHPLRQKTSFEDSCFSSSMMTRALLLHRLSL